MKSILFIFAVLMIPIEFFGQTNFYLDFSGTYSFIPSKELIDNSSYTDPFGGSISTKFTERYEVKPGLTLGIGFSKKLIHRFSISLGLGFAYYQYKKVTQMDFVDNYQTGDINLIEELGVPIGILYGELGGFRFQEINPDSNDALVIENPNYEKIKILYLSIPLKFQYSIIPERLTIGIGVTNYFVAYSSQLKNIIDFETQPISQKEYNDESSNGLNNYQLNGNISLEYRILKALWIQTSYNHGFLRIYDKPQQNNYPSIRIGDAKYRTVELGLKFEL